MNRLRDLQKRAGQGLVSGEELQSLRDSGVALTQSGKEKLAAYEALHLPTEVDPNAIASAEKLAEQARIDHEEVAAEHLVTIKNFIASVEGYRASYASAVEAARIARRIGGKARNPVAIAADQDYVTRTLVKDFHQAARAAI